MKKNHSLVPKGKGRVLTIVLSVIAGLVIAVGGFAAYWYHTGDITGTWRSSSMETTLQQIVMTQMEEEFSGLPDGLDLNYKDLVSDYVVEMTVKDGKMKIVASYTFNKELMVTAYSNMVEEEYNRILQESAEIAAQGGTSLEELLTITYGSDYETAIKKLFPSVEDFESELDAELQTSLEETSATYDSETGVISETIATGRVNRFLHVLTDVTVWEDFGMEDTTDLTTYSRSGKKVVLAGNKSWTFTLSE